MLENAEFDSRIVKFERKPFGISFLGGRKQTSQWSVCWDGWQNSTRQPNFRAGNRNVRKLWHSIVGAQHVCAEGGVAVYGSVWEGWQCMAGWMHWWAAMRAHFPG